MVVAGHRSGIGIAAADQPRLFTIFEQMDGSATRSLKARVGLALCKRLVEGMGGRGRGERAGQRQLLLG